MHVVRSEEQKYAGGRIKRFAVDEVYARSVGSCGEFPVAVAVQNAVIIPQKSGDFFRLQFLNDFFYGNVFHSHILTITDVFVNII